MVDTVDTAAKWSLWRDWMSGRSEIDGELNVRIARTSLPASFESAGGECCGMQTHDRMSGGIEREGDVFGRKVAQMKKDDSVLDCWRL